MAPGPSLTDLISVVRADAGSGEPLAQLEQAARTAAEMEQTADDLLGHFVELCRQSGRSWAEISNVLGVSRQAAHKRFTAPLPGGAGEPVAFDRFTARGRAALAEAAETAKQLGHPFIGTEHLLLGLSTDPGAISAQVLAEVGLDRDRILELVTAKIPTGEPLGAEFTTPLTPRSMQALRQAVEESLKLGHNYVGTEHLLLALFGNEESVAYAVLADAGVTYDDASRRAVELLSGRKPAA
jgi:hypothetical protein